MTVPSASMFAPSTSSTKLEQIHDDDMASSASSDADSDDSDAGSSDGDSDASDVSTPLATHSPSHARRVSQATSLQQAHPRAAHFQHVPGQQPQPHALLILPASQIPLPAVSNGGAKSAHGCVPLAAQPWFSNRVPRGIQRITVSDPRVTAKGHRRAAPMLPVWRE